MQDTMNWWRYACVIAFCTLKILAYPQEQSSLNITPPKTLQEYEYAEGDERGRNFRSPYANPKDGVYFLDKYISSLEKFYEALNLNSAKGQYAHFRGRILIDHKTYDSLSQSQKSKFQGAVVMSRVYISAFLKYSEFGGVGIGGKFQPSDEKVRYFSVDGRYFTDLQEFGVDHLIYLLCVLPRFDKCIVLGIGEEW